MVRVRRTFKDTVFRMLFSAPPNMLSLYNALNHSDYTDPSALEVTTLEDAIYMGMRNDCSFVFNQDLNIFEHQSTVNPNMPLRDFFYLANILIKRIPNEDLFRQKKVELPNPRFVVFYQGEKDLPTRSVYKLSDLYVKKNESPELELTVTVINIDPAKEDQLLRTCSLLSEFAKFVSITRSYLDNADSTKQKSKEQAIEEAIDDCISNGILTDFLQKERKKVLTSILADYDEQKVRKVLAEDAYSMGVAEGRVEGAAAGEQKFSKLVSILLKEGKTTEAALVAADPKEREKYYALYGING